MVILPIFKENNVDPQYLAYIMKSIENGLSMKTDPIKVYEHLFSRGNLEAPLVALGPTAAISTEVRRFTSTHTSHHTDHAYKYSQ